MRLFFTDDGYAIPTYCRSRELRPAMYFWLGKCYHWPSFLLLECRTMWGLFCEWGPLTTQSGHQAQDSESQLKQFTEQMIVCSLLQESIAILCEDTPFSYKAIPLGIKSFPFKWQCSSTKLLLFLFSSIQIYSAPSLCQILCAAWQPQTWIGNGFRCVQTVERGTCGAKYMDSTGNMYRIWF